MATIELECPFEGCTYKTGEVSEAVACCLLSVHMTKHKNLYAYRGPTTATSCISIACTTWSKTTQRAILASYQKSGMSSNAGGMHLGLDPALIQMSHPPWPASTG